jgi:hypothetical protein
MRTVAILLLLFALAQTGWAQESPPPPGQEPPQEKPELQECVPPPMDKMEEFFEVNPTVRNLYYAYLRRGIPSPPNRGLPEDNPGEDPDRFIFEGRFKMYISDLFNVNARMVQAAREADYLLKLDPAQSANHSVQEQFRTVEKESSRLAGRLVIVLPGDMGSSTGGRSLKESYDTMGDKGYLKALVQLLAHKLGTFENRFCNFMFPNTHTVTLYELSVHSTPYTDLKEIQAIAKALADHFPARGIPRGYNKD